MEEFLRGRLDPLFILDMELEIGDLNVVGVMG